MRDFDFIRMMIEETCKSHSASYHVLCVEDDYCRYKLSCEFVNGVPSICITYDDVNGNVEVYKEVTNVSDTQALKDLLEVWQEIEDSFDVED